MQRTTVNLPGEAPGESRLPISPAVIAGDLVFTSGHVGWPPGSRVAPAGIEAQTEQTLKNLEAVLEAAGTSLEHVVKANVYLIDINDFQAMNQIYRRYFPNDPPARTTVGVAALAGADLRIEIEMVALLPEARSA